MPNSFCSAIFALLLSVTCVSVDPPEGSPLPRVTHAKEIEWKGIFGKREKDEHQGYVLLATEFLSMPFLSGPPNECQDLEKVVAAWLGQHPTATAIPVRKLELGDEFSFVFVWIVNAQENLNITLVRKGCAEARKMEVDDPSGLLVKREEYQQFVDSVKKAEAAAIQDKAGIWGKPGADRAAHWTTAERLEQRGQFQEAIPEFLASMGGEYNASAVWFRIGRCYQQMQQFQQAVEAYDKSLQLADDEISRRFATIAKAECVTRLEGKEGAARVFGAERPDCSRSLDPCMDLAVVHGVSGNFMEAEKVMEEGVKAFMAFNELKFDGLNFVLDEPRVKRSEKYWLAVNELGSGLPAMARYSIDMEDQDRALRNATMALSVRRAIMEYLKDRYDPLVIEAGDFDARLVLAKVYGKQGKFEEAKREVDQAKVLIDLGYLQGGFSRDTLDRAYEELRGQFPDRKVEVPPTYKPKAEKKPKPFAPEEVTAMAEEQLIAGAAGDDPASQFAVLEELVGRHSRGAVSVAGLKQLVKDGLDRQSDTKKRWLAQYGVFIEDAWDKGTLPEADLRRYVRRAAVVHEFDVSYASFDLGPAEQNTRLNAGVTVEGRVGGNGM